MYSTRDRIEGLQEDFSALPPLSPPIIVTSTLDEAKSNIVTWLSSFLAYLSSTFRFNLVTSRFKSSLKKKTVQSLQSSVPKKNLSFTQFHGIDGRGWATRCTEISIEQTIQQLRICLYFFARKLCLNSSLLFNSVVSELNPLTSENSKWTVFCE